MKKKVKKTKMYAYILTVCTEDNTHFTSNYEIEVDKDWKEADIFTFVLEAVCNRLGFDPKKVIIFFWHLSEC